MFALLQCLFFLFVFFTNVDFIFVSFSQAFRLIDRENKGYISRKDVFRILCTTNVQDLEYVNQQHKALADANASAGVSTSGITSSTTATNSLRGAGLGALTPTHSVMGLGIARLGSVGRIGSGGSIRSVNSVDDAEHQRNRKLEQRIDAIMQQADVNHDGVIR